MEKRQQHFNSEHHEFTEPFHTESNTVSKFGEIARFEINRLELLNRCFGQMSTDLSLKAINITTNLSTCHKVARTLPNLDLIPKIAELKTFNHLDLFILSQVHKIQKSI